jgi:tetratricopeptide (TPR) repeat protein
MVTNKFRKFPLIVFTLLFILFAGLGCQQPQTQPAASEMFEPEPVEEPTALTPDEEQRMQAVSLYVDAMMLNDLNDREKAIQKLNQAVELDPEFALAFSLKGDILQDMEEFEDSADAYERATELDPWSFKDFFNLGKVCQAIKQFARAVRAYVAACSLDPQHYPAHLGAAQCYFQLKELDDAMAYAEMAKELAPDQAEPEQLLGDIFEEQKDHTQAINAYRRALELEGNQPDIMVALARAYLRSGRYSAAKELLTDTIEMQPDNGIAYQYLGFAELKLKNTQTAVENYQQAVEIDENDWMAHKGLGVAYMLMSMQNRDENLQAQALEQWNISLQIKPDQPKLKKLLERYTN